MNSDGNVDRFDFEEALMACSQTTEDLKLVIDGVLTEELTTDEIANALLGIEQLHELRHRKAFDMLEALIENRKLL